MSNETVNFHPDGTLFIVSGPSGAGKTTLIRRVQENLSRIQIRLHFSVSHTTRPMRSTEEDGRDYHFVSREVFQSMVDGGEFLEWAHVHQQMYGTSRAEVQTRLERGEDVILDIDVQGAQQIAKNRDLKPHSLSVFLFPPSFEELERRLLGRRLNSDAEIELRLAKAIEEIERGFDNDLYDYVIINDDVEVATACLESAVVARKLRSKSALTAIREMAQRFKEERSGRYARGNR